MFPIIEENNKIVKHEEILFKMKHKLKTLHGKKDEKSQEEIFIIEKTIEKIEIIIKNS